MIKSQVTGQPLSPTGRDEKDAYNQQKARESQARDEKRQSTPLSTVGSTNRQDKFAQPAPEAHPR
jgi:hypothetical protein